MEISAVTATGVTKGATVVFFSVAREPSEFGGVIVRREQIVADTDSDGNVRYDLGNSVPLRSIWAAVDLTSGEFRLATPEGYPLRDLDGGSVLPGPAGKFDRLAANREFVLVLVARPGKGAWVATLYDGATGDEDGPANRSVRTAIAGLEPVGDSGSVPEILLPLDIVVVMDPNAMAVVATRLVGGLNGLPAGASR